MAAELKSALNIDTQLIAEGKGIFDVEVDGQLLFSKYQTGRFPEPGEILNLVQSA